MLRIPNRHTRLRRNPLPFPIVFGLVLAGCSRDRAPSEGGFDNGSVPTVLLPVSAPDGPQWTTRPLFSTETSDSVQIGGSVDAVFSNDTSLVIGSGGALLQLSATGTFVRRLGREGDGPGEFRTLYRLGIAADGSLFAADLWSGRFTQMTVEGGLVRIIARFVPVDAGVRSSRSVYFPAATLSRHSGNGGPTAAPWPELSRTIWSAIRCR